MQVEVVLGMLNRVGCPDNSSVHVCMCVLAHQLSLSPCSDVISRIVATQVNIMSISGG